MSVCNLAHAESVKYRRIVEFEWEPIENAKSYELELQKLQMESQKPEGKIHLFKSELSHWNGKLEPGPYQMRVRAKDWRKVPGEWSSPEIFKVGLDDVKILFPKAKDLIHSSSAQEAAVQFQWESVGGAESYQINITSNDESFRKELSVSKTMAEFDLPVAHEYTWKIKARGLGLESDHETSNQFSLLGRKISAPKILAPENKFVREVSWKPSEDAKDYSYLVQRYNPQQKKWEDLARNPSSAENKIQINPNWPGGRYKVILKAQGALRVSSDVVQLSFDVKAGDRSPAAEEVATVRQSIDRLTGWYGIASYLVTVMSYSDSNNDVNSTAEFKGIGGTGRIGLGNLSSKSNWGFLGILDMSGILIDGFGNYTFASSEIGAVYRSNTSDHGEIRQHLGGFYKELPELIIDHQTLNLKEVNQLKFAGAHYGVEYWYALNSKLGLQANFHLYSNLVALATPRSHELSSSGSFQVGFLGSYRLKKNMTGLVGYAYRLDEMKYKTGEAAAIPGEVNTATIQGHYLNLFLEWAL